MHARTSRPGRLPRRSTSSTRSGIGRDDRRATCNWRKLGPAPRHRRPDAAAARPRRAARHRVAPTCACRSTCARSSPASSTASRFEEFKPLYGTHAGRAAGPRSAATPSAILANNGILFSEEAQKGAQFIQLCNRTDTPLLFVQNITGFMVGTRYEQGGIIKDGAKLINAVSNSTVPAPHADGRGVLRRRQLRHGRPRVRPALRLHLAQPPHRGDGSQAARRRA